MEFVKSGYIIEGFVPKLKDYDENDYFIQEGVTYHETLQLISWIVEGEAGMDLNYSFFLVCRGGNDKNQLWVAKVLLLFRAYAGRKNIGVKLTFIQYMECSPPIIQRDHRLGSVCLWWSTDDEMDHPVESRAFSKNRKYMMIGE